MRVLQSDSTEMLNLEQKARVARNRLRALEFQGLKGSRLGSSGSLVCSSEGRGAVGDGGADVDAGSCHGTTPRPSVEGAEGDVDEARLVPELQPELEYAVESRGRCYVDGAANMIGLAPHVSSAIRSVDGASIGAGRGCAEVAVSGEGSAPPEVSLVVPLSTLGGMSRRGRTTCRDPCLASQSQICRVRLGASRWRWAGADNRTEVAHRQESPRFD